MATDYDDLCKLRISIENQLKSEKKCYIYFSDGNSARDELTQLLTLILNNKYTLRLCENDRLKRIKIDSILRDEYKIEVAVICPNNFVVLYSNRSSSNPLFVSTINDGINLTCEFNNWYCRTGEEKNVDKNTTIDSKFTIESLRELIADNLLFDKNCYIVLKGDDSDKNRLIALIKVILNNERVLHYQDRFCLVPITIDDVLNTKNKFRIAIICPTNSVVLFSDITANTPLQNMIRVGVDLTYEFNNWYKEHTTKAIKDEFNNWYEEYTTKATKDETLSNTKENKIKDMTMEQECRFRFRDKLNSKLQHNYACHINLGENSFNLMISIFQCLIKNVKDCRYYIYDKHSQKVEYNKLYCFRDTINAKAATLYIFKDKRIEINLGSSSIKSASLNELVENWVTSRTEPHSFAQMLKDNHNYFINFQDKKLAIFFKEFCKEHKINNFDDCQTALDSFINVGLGSLVLGKKDGLSFYYMPLGVIGDCCSNEDQEYWIDVTHILNTIYLNNIDNTIESTTDVVKPERGIKVNKSTESFEENNEIIEKFLNGREITIQFRNGGDKSKCARILNELQEVATFRLEPKNLTVPRYIWDLLNPIYTQILFNHETKNLLCYTDNYQMIFDLEKNSWSYELKNCNDPNSPCIIPLEALREELDVTDLEPRFALAVRPQTQK